MTEFRRNCRCLARRAAPVALVSLLAACAGEEAAPDVIVIGQATPLSGPFAVPVSQTTGPVYDMWIDEVNARGGIYLSKYDKRVPVELLQYDDESDPEVMKQQLERLMLEDHVDLLLPPFSTEFLFEAAPLADRYGYVLMSGAGGAAKLAELTSSLPYFFTVLNHSTTQMPALASKKPRSSS